MVNVYFLDCARQPLFTFSFFFVMFVLDGVFLACEFLKHACVSADLERATCFGIIANANAITNERPMLHAHIKTKRAGE